MRLLRLWSICSVKRDRLRGHTAVPVPSGLMLRYPKMRPCLETSGMENTTSPESADALQEACDEIARLWEEEVIPLLG